MKQIRLPDRRMLVDCVRQCRYCREEKYYPFEDVHDFAYRRAAWAIEDTSQDLGLIYRQMGLKGLQSIQDVGPKLAKVVETLIREWT